MTRSVARLSFALALLWSAGTLAQVPPAKHPHAHGHPKAHGPGVPSAAHDSPAQAPVAAAPAAPDSQLQAQAAPAGTAPQAPPDPQPEAAEPPPSAAAPTPDPVTAKVEHAALPAEHQPRLSLKIDPPKSVKVGELVHLELAAVAPVGDDVTVAEQTLLPFEIYKKQARVEPPQGATQRFVFNLDLIAVEAGDKPVPAVELRVVTKDNNIGMVETAPVPFKVLSLVANEPNAQPKLESKPVAVLEDNYIPIYVLVGLLAAAAVAGLTLLIARYLRKRKAAAVPPPPPRPPWEIAVEKLAELRRQKQLLLDAGKGGLFVDQLSDVVRAYLGGRYVFDGLETTSDEMLTQLKVHGASLGFTQEVGQFLYRCDLVKFAKVEPDADEVDLLFAKAQDLVHLSEPERAGARAHTSPPLAAADSTLEPPRLGGTSRRPHDGGSPP